MGRKKKEEMIICKHCGKEIAKKSVYCPNCGTKLNSSILLFFIIMLPLFLAVFFTANASSIFYYVIEGFKYGREFIVEAMLAFVVVVVTLISGNAYIFTQRKDGIVKSLLAGWPILLIAGVNLFSSVVSIITTGDFNIFNIFNLVLFCCAIGVYEEFLCRGWLFNEFIERFGHTKKQVALSIILSALIFGGIHFINLFSTSQGLIITIAQIVQATASGMFLASLYYKNRNIWSVIILHAFYDFAIFLSSSGLLKDCTTGTISTGMMIYLALSSIIIAAYFIIGSIITLRHSERWNNLPSKKDTAINTKPKNNTVLYVCAFVLFASLLLPIAPYIEGYDKYQVCYEYEELIINNYEMIEVDTDKHTISTSQIVYTQQEEREGVNIVPITKVNHFKFDVYLDDSNVILENTNTKDKIVLNDKGLLVKDVIVYETDSYIAIAYYYDDISGSIVHHAIIPKGTLENDKEYLQTVKNLFDKTELPTIRGIGYLTERNTNKKYFYMYSTLGDQFVIDEFGKDYVLVYE